MAEVIDWSPVDESNNSPPPVGAPEHHAPSATNNIMRAMMGAIRRWHDTVNTRLGTFLPLSGGTLTGNTSFNGPLGISIQGTWLDGDGAGNLVVRNVAGANAAGAVMSVGYGAAFLFSDRDMVSPSWGWSANAGTAAFGRFNEAAIISVSGSRLVTVTGNLTTTGNITVGGNFATANVTASGQVTGAYLYSTGNIHANGAIDTDTNVIADGSITSGGNITSGGTLRGAFITSTGGIHADGGISADGVITADGNISTAGDLSTTNITAASQVTGAYLYSTGNIGAAGTISSAHLTTTGNVSAAGSVSGAYVASTGSIHANGAIDSDSNISADGNVTAGGTVTGNVVTANTVNATNITGASVVGTTSLATRDTTGDITCGLYTSGTVTYLQFLNKPSNANRWEWDGSNGDLQWRSLNVVHWVMRRSSDSMCFNALGPVGGNGAYYNSSDGRGKEDIEPARCGLESVMELNPVSFKRIGKDDYEVGFIAQELREVFPEAVRVVGMPLPDDTGGPEDENPTLGVDTTPIIAALVNAMKELSGRISILEGKRHE